MRLGDQRSANARLLSVITRLADGGSERRLIDVLEALPEIDHQIIVGADSSPAKIAVLADRYPVEVCPTLVRSIDPIKDVATVYHLRRKMREPAFDAVFTHQSKAGLLGRVAARLARIPHVYHSASMASFGPGYGWVEHHAFALAERFTAPLVDRYFVVGTDLAARLRRNGLASHKIEIVRSSLDLGAFQAACRSGQAEARVKLGLCLDEAVVCFVGSLDSRKGADHLIEMHCRLRQIHGEPVHLLVAGTGPHAGLIRDQAANLGVTDSVRLLGHTDQVPLVMAASDLLLLPSVAEGLPQVLVQAAAAGLPFVAFEVDGVGEMLEFGASGVVAPIGDFESFAALGGERLGHRKGGRSEAPFLGNAEAQEWQPASVRDEYRNALAGELLESQGEFTRSKPSPAKKRHTAEAL